MELGVHLPVAGKGASPETIMQVAVEAERRRVGLGVVLGAADAADGADRDGRAGRTGDGCARDVRHCV